MATRTNDVTNQSVLIINVVIQVITEAKMMLVEHEGHTPQSGHSAHNAIVEEDQHNS